MLYDYKCRACGGERLNVYNRIDNRRTNAPMCCDSPMEIMITAAPMGFVDREIRYVCPVTNEGVTTRKQRNEIMARNDLVDANDIVNHKTIAARKKQHEERKAFVEQHRGPKEIEEKVWRWAAQ
jgi:hypothetical protein